MPDIAKRYVGRFFRYIASTAGSTLLTPKMPNPKKCSQVFDSTVATSEGEVLFKGTDVAFRKALGKIFWGFGWIIGIYDIPNKYPPYKVYMGLITKGTYFKGTTPFSLWMKDTCGRMLRRSECVGDASESFLESIFQTDTFLSFIQQIHNKTLGFAK